MNNVWDLISVVERDRQADRRIARVSVRPEHWQRISISNVAEGDWRFPESQNPDVPRPPDGEMPRFDIFGVPLEIDELQEEDFRLWDAQGGSIEP